MNPPTLMPEPASVLPWQASGLRTGNHSRRNGATIVRDKRRSVQALLAALATAIALPLAAQQPPTGVEKEIAALKARLAELERIVKQQTGSTSSPPVASGVAPTSPATAPTTSDTSGVEFVRWNEVVAGKSRFRLYGFLRADAIYDDSRPNNTLVPAFIRSENSGGAGFQSPPNHEDFTVHPRLTRFGLDFSGPKVEALWDAKVGGKAEVDFYNLIPGGAESREALRMRHVYISLKWPNAQLLAGQTSDLISQYFPVVNPDFVMWGAGNLGDRRPQVRFDYTPTLGPGTLMAQGEAGMTGADDNQDLGGNGFRDGEASGVPTVQARLGYRFELWQGQNAEIAGWGHYAREKTDIPTGLSGRQDFTSEAVGIDLFVPIWKDILSLKGEAWFGKNLDDIRGGILQGVNSALGEEIHSRGGWIEVTLKPAKWYSFHGGFLTDDPQHTDLPAAGATIGRDLNSVWYMAGRLYFEPLEFGLDYLNWTTYYADRVGKGQDNRFQASITYKF